MKNQSIILMLSFTAFSGGLAAHAMDERDGEYPRAEGQLSARHLALGEELQHVLEDDIKRRLAHQSSLEFEGQWRALKEADEEAQHEINCLLVSADDEENAVKWAIEKSLEVAEVRVPPIGLSDNPDGRDTRRESDAVADRVIAAFAKAKEEEEAQREEKKRLAKETIYSLCPRIAALRKEEKEIGAKASRALTVYTYTHLNLADMLDYVTVDSAEVVDATPEGSHEDKVSEAEEAWGTLARKHDSVSLKLRQAIAQRNSLLDDHYFQGIQGEEGKGWIERILSIRFQITKLEQEVKEKKARAVDASGEAYGEPEEPGAADEERKSARETPADLEAEAAAAQAALEKAIQEETAMINGYIAALFHPDIPLT